VALHGLCSFYRLHRLRSDGRITGERMVLEIEYSTDHNQRA